jgi:nucleoside-diphosphate-sugar epimerase
MIAALNDEPINMTDPVTSRDFVYVDDVVDTYLNIDALQKLRGEILNVGTGVQSSLADVVETTESLLHRKIDVRWHGMPPREWDTDIWVADASKLRQLTGSCPKTNLRTGLARCLEWFSANLRFYRENIRSC